MDKHPNSKTITIFRAGSSLSRAQGKDVEHHFESAKVSVGSYFESSQSQKVASGLTFTEEAILLPSIIDAESTDRQFRERVKQFYVDIDTKVPFGIGTTLEIGLTIDNAEPVTLNRDKPEKSNLPLNLMDYIRYRHAVGHPYMAKSKEEADGNSLKQYYIFDKETIISRNSNKNKNKDAALQIYLTIKQDGKKVDMMLTLLGRDPREFTGKEKDELKVEALRDFSDANPEEFIKVYQEAELEISYWIKTMVNTGVLKVLNSKYYDAETNKLIGNNHEETTYYFKDEANSEEVIMLKARMQEAMKKPVNPTKRKTVLSR